MADPLEPFVKEFKKLGEDLLEDLHKSHRQYRIAGIGLSATLIAVSGATIAQLPDFGASPFAKLSILLSLGVSILAAILVQFCNYLGQQLVARNAYLIWGYYVMAGNLVEQRENDDSRASEKRENKRKAQENWDKSIWWFDRSDAMVWVAVIASIVGLLIFGILLGTAFFSEGLQNG